MSQANLNTNGYMDTLESDSLLSRMRILNKKFKNACSQVILLNNQIEYIQVRYDRAVKSNKRSYRYFERLRLATLEGIRNMVYEYACRRADELDEMQEQLVQEGVIDSDYDMDENDSDTEAHNSMDLNEDAHLGIVLNQEPEQVMTNETEQIVVNEPEEIVVNEEPEIHNTNSQQDDTHTVHFNKSS